MYYGVWEDAVEALPNTFPSLAEAQALPQWTALTESAAAAAGIFARRGPLPEDREAN